MRNRAVLILALATFGAPAGADPLLVTDAPDGPTPASWRSLLEEIGRRGLVVADRTSLLTDLERSATDAPLPPRTEVTERIEEARARFRETHLRDALAALAAADSQLGHWAAEPEGARLAWEIAFLRGAWHLALDEPDAARAAFRAAVAIDAAREPPEGATPSVGRVFRETRSALLSQARSVIRVGSTPPGASAWVDGVPLGTTPRAVEVVPGLHRIRLALAGWSEATVVRELAPGESSELHETLSPAARGDAARQLVAALGERASLSASDLEALARVVGDPRAGTLRLLSASPPSIEALVVTPGAPTARLGPIALPSELDAVRALAGRLGSLLGVEEASPFAAARRATAPPRRSWLARHWPWIAAAGAVVVAGASAALLVPDYGEGTVDVTARRASW